MCIVYQADSRSSLVKVHFDQLSTSDFWCCLCSRILRQPQGSTSNLRKHLQARHPKEFASITQMMSDDSFVKVEDSNGMLLFNGYCSWAANENVFLDFICKHIFWISVTISVQTLYSVHTIGCFVQKQQIT